MIEGTTIVAVHRDGRAVVAGDGQVTWGGNTILKHRARKVRRLYQDQVVAGFAGSVADAFTLFENLEGKLQSHSGNLLRAAVALARDWRTDRALRRLEALLVAADGRHLLVLSGSGEVIEPDDGIAAVGSGGPYALAAARALAGFTDLPPRRIAEEALRVAASICVYTNENITIEEL
ncbi:MAG: ATP-dependent protease subunit HslV [Thermaerobacter sp.]|jgi:ATP-dependent HslUV protease subunit HslV|nr:ATP-dependent protease subunit HslV [Thermaerobacter sp.]MDA8146272.1 ATP-dependent protease subunit HslV [Thermaerobacter sp.]